MRRQDQRNWLLVCLMVICLAFAGCVSAPIGPTPQPQEVITFAAPIALAAAYAPLIDAFMQDHPGIVVRFVPSESIPGADAVDPVVSLRRILSVADTALVQGGVPTDSLTPDLVLDLAPLLAAAPGDFDDDFVPGALDPHPQTGIVGTLPIQLRVPLLFYNADRWAAAGLPPPTGPLSPADLLSAAGVLAETRGGEIRTYGLIDPGGLIALPELLRQAGDTTLSDLRTPAVASALDAAAARARSGALVIPTADDPDRTYAALSERVIAGEVGLWRPGAPAFATNTPLPFTLGAMPLPRSAGPQIVIADGYVISAGTAYARTAWEWLRFLSDQPPPALMVESIGDIPARQSAADVRSDLPAVQEAIAQALAQPSTPDLPLDALALAVLAEALDATLQGVPVPRALEEATIALDRLRAAETALSGTVASPLPVATLPPAPTAAPGVTTIRYAGFFSPDRLRSLQAAVNRFQVLTPGVRVTLVNLFDTMRVSPGRTLSESDIAMLGDCFSLFYPIPIDTLRDVALDLEPLMDADPSFDRDDYPAALLLPFADGAAHYGLPENMTVRTLRYNPDLFDAAGIAYPDATWTLDTLVGTAEALTDREREPPQYGLILPEVAQVGYFLARHDARPALVRDGQVRVQFTDARVLHALLEYVNLVQRGSPHERLNGIRSGVTPADNSTVGEPGDDVEAFRPVWEGRAAMWLDFGESQGDTYRLPGETIVYDDPMVAPPLGETPLTTADLRVSGMYISASTPAPEACWAWLRFLSGEPTVIERGTLPARRSVAESEVFAELAPVGAVAVYAGYAAALARSIPAEARAPVLLPEVDYYWFYLALERAIQGEPLEHALNEAQGRTEAHLTCVARGGQPAACAREVDPEYAGFAAP